MIFNIQISTRFRFNVATGKMQLPNAGVERLLHKSGYNIIKEVLARSCPAAQGQISTGHLCHRVIFGPPCQKYFYSGLDGFSM